MSHAKRSRAIAAFALGMAVLISACSTPSPPRSALPPHTTLNSAELWERRLAHLASLGDWKASGKVAYRLPDDAGSASLQWQQEGDRSLVRLSGPLGAGSTRISSEGALLRVQRDGIERLYPADAAPWLPGGALLPVPVDSIRHWLQGAPDPALPSGGLELSEGLATRFVQLGWEIDIQDYSETQGLPMPVRLTLSAPAVELVLRVIVREWRLP